MIDLPLVWFLILSVLLTGYMILDGFDLGVGIVYLTVRGDRERRLALNSIGPLWDGNEVWLVTFGGGLFAAFPEAYATLLSGLYLPVMILLFSLIGRAISIEFRSKRPSKLWRAYWDGSFWLSSLTATFIFGIAAGNAMRGLPLDARGEFSGTPADIINPYAVAVGVFTIVVLAHHGANFLYLKTEGPLQALARRLQWRTYFGLVVSYVAITVFTVQAVPSAIANFERWPAAWGVVVLNVVVMANMPWALRTRRGAYAFASSCAVIAALLFLFAMAIFPNLVASSSSAPSLTIWTAASSQNTLETMGWVALIGAPLVLLYTAIVYWVFRGKVKLGKFSY